MFLGRKRNLECFSSCGPRVCTGASGPVAIELLAMVDYVTDTLKTARLKKVDTIDMAVANATSPMLPAGRQPSCSTVDRLVGESA